MIWYEDQLKIVGIPANEFAMIVGSTDDMVSNIIIDHYKDFKLVQSIVEWQKPIPNWKHVELINEDIRTTYSNKIARIKTKHESKKYDLWIQYMSSNKDKK